MSAVYSEDEYLPLSGVQHYAYCPRQWALILIEQQWAENERTASGELLHSRCHNPIIREKRGDLISVRGLRVTSSLLGLSGECDVVEFRSSPVGVRLCGLEGLWLPAPVEYKRGKGKPGDEDRMQVCAQAMSLEEMFCCDIASGFLYYDSEKHRETVPIDADLRSSTALVSVKMHETFSRGTTPKVARKSGCKSCSLQDVCMPELEKSPSVKKYIDGVIEGSLP